MNDRDYLRSLGFTVGQRGRFSNEMLDALAARKIADAEDALVDEVVEAGVPESVIRTPLRSPRELYGYTREGWKVGFITCSWCGEHMMWCECPGGVLAPDIVVKCEEPLVRVAPR